MNHFFGRQFYSTETICLIILHWCSITSRSSAKCGTPFHRKWYEMFQFSIGRHFLESRQSKLGRNSTDVSVISPLRQLIIIQNMRSCMQFSNTVYQWKTMMRFLGCILTTDNKYCMHNFNFKFARWCYGVVTRGEGVNAKKLEFPS